MRQVRNQDWVVKHWIGQTVRNKRARWLGQVLEMECLLCGNSILTPVVTCPHNRYSLTIDQGGVRKPWCSLEDYQDATVRPTAWERILKVS
jgi:hypothetical protein